MILIVAAMEEEYNELLALLTNHREGNIHGVKYHQGELEGKSVLLMLSGIGKVNAAWRVVTILNEFKITYIINIGSAGGVLNDYHVKPLDIVIARKVVRHDVDLTAANRPYGQLPDLPLYFLPSISQEMVDELAKTDLPFHYATIASGDSFVADLEKVNFITKHFEDVCAVEMEAGAIAQIAFQRNIPFVVFRSISDVVGAEDDNQTQFEQYIVQASKNSAKAVQAIIHTID